VKRRPLFLLSPPTRGPWQPDQLLMDERSSGTGQRVGLIIFTTDPTRRGLCDTHAKSFHYYTIHAVMGGLHLGGAWKKIITETVAALRPFNIRISSTAIARGRACMLWHPLPAYLQIPPNGESRQSAAVGHHLHFAAAEARR